MEIVYIQCYIMLRVIQRFEHFGIKMVATCKANLYSFLQRDYLLGALIPIYPPQVPATSCRGPTRRLQPTKSGHQTLPVPTEVLP